MKIILVDNNGKEFTEEYTDIAKAKQRIKTLYEEDSNSLDALADSKITVRGMDTKELAEYANSLLTEK